MKHLFKTSVIAVLGTSIVNRLQSHDDNSRNPADIISGQEMVMVEASQTQSVVNLKGCA